MTDDEAIRPGVPADADGIVRVDPRAIAGSARRESIHRALGAGRCFVVMTGDGRIAGYAILEYGFFDNGFVSLLHVAGPFRRRGLGAALMARLARECRTAKLFTSTNASNAPMRALLAKAGFVPSGVIENLDDGDAELVFFKWVRD